MKLYYFGVYGRGEPIRMVLHKAGVEFEDVRFTQDQWKEAKAAGLSPSGQLPMIELDDGTKMTQCDAICRYLATVHGLVPKDPMTEYHGEAALAAFNGDFWGKQGPKLFSNPVEKFPEIYEEMSTGAFVDYCKTLEARLDKGKWICGEQFTWYDIMLCSFFINLVENPNNRGKASWDKAIPLMPARVTQYIADFKAEFADHLAKRPPSEMGL